MKNFNLFKTGIILFITFLAYSHTRCQVVFSDWAIGTGTKGWDIVNDIACDTLGNIYITGSHTDTAGKPGTTGIHSITRKCMFIARYDTSGKLLWRKNISGSESGFGSLIAVADPGQIILAGGSEIMKGKSKSQPGKFDFFISSIDSAGTVKWKQNFTGIRNDFLTSLSVDIPGKLIIISGYFHDTLRIHGKKMISAGKSDGFLLKFNLDGTLKDAQITGGKGNDRLEYLATNPSGEIFAAGTFQRKIQFSKTKSLELSNPHQMAMFLSKYSPSGDLTDAKQLITGKKIRVDGILSRDNLCFITGSFSDDITINGQVFNSKGSDDIFLICLDNSLQVKWHKQFGGTRKDRAAGLISIMDEIVLTGSYCTEITIDQKKLTASGTGSDLFVMATDTAGTLKWLRSAGGDADDYPTCMTAGTGNYIYVAGLFRKSFKLNDQIIPSNGEEDLFICRLESCHAPAPVFSEPESFCEGEQLKLDAGKGFISYNWANGLGTQQTFIVNQKGNYSLELIAGNGCTIYDTIEVVDIALPVFDLGNDTTIFDTSGIVLHADQKFKHYLWNNGITTPENKIRGTDLHAGPNFVWLKVTNEKGCSADDDIVITVISPDNDQYPDIVSGSCVLYPNPTHETFAVSFTLSYKSISFVIYDPAGKDILAKTVTDYLKSTPIEFTLGAAPKGWYTLYIKTELGTATKKIILD